MRVSSTLSPKKSEKDKKIYVVAQREDSCRRLYPLLLNPLAIFEGLDFCGESMGCISVVTDSRPLFLCISFVASYMNKSIVRIGMCVLKALVK